MAGGFGDDAGAHPPFPLWSFREDVYIEADPLAGTIVVHSRWEDTSLPAPRASVLDAMRRMSLGPISLANVIHDSADRLELVGILDQLQHLVVRSFGVDPAQPLISVVPLTPQARFELSAHPAVHAVRLSRFALIRTDGSDYLIESPLSLHRVILHQTDALAQLGALFRPAVPAPADQHPHSVISYLLAAGMAVEAAEGDPFQPVQFAEDVDPALVTWSPIDLMFHTHSTLGRHDHDFGATYPLGEHGSVEPVVKPRPAGTPVVLPRPTWDGLLASDPSLTVALEATRNSRRFGAGPVTLGELGELLYRTVRLRALAGSADPASTAATSDRPYLSGGSCYELELYVVAHRCAGVPRGAYHYDPYGHLLTPTPDQEGVDELLERGRVAANLESTPPVLLTITARFRRVSWKYNGLSYSLVLKNVGALAQTLSLVSTAMGLVASGLEGGDIEASLRFFGLDWRVESSVGGIAVGHRPDKEQLSAAGRYPVNDAEWPALARAMLS